MNPFSLVNQIGRSIGQIPWLFRVPMILALLGLAALVGLVIFIQIYTARPPTQAELWQVNREPSLTILDERGGTLATRGAFYGETVSLRDLPVYLTHAFVAIEDRRFFDHEGVDYWGLTRAMVANIRAGGVVQGGSTISQQLAKNLFLSSDRTLARKVEEVFLAMWLERHLTKDEILELYINRIYLGAGTYGVDAAARFYFGKSARDLTLAEAAMLAGLPKAPSRYAPTTDLAQAQARASLVLNAMVKEHYITQDQADAARAQPAQPIGFANSDGQQYFVDFVISELGDLIGETHRNLLITTTLDRTLQSAAEETLTFRLERDGDALGATQGALVTLTPDGAIRAMVGGRDYATSQFNRAVQAQRQPGSSFKPFVYLTALESGVTPDTYYIDEPVRIGNWEPGNYNGRYIGRVTVADALRQSINTIAAQVGRDVGAEAIVTTAQRLGIRSDLDPVPSIALGAAEVNLLEMTTAYAVFQTSGNSVTRYAITRIQAEDGSVLYQREAPTAPARIVDEGLAREMNQMLYSVVETGTGTAADLGRREAAGKTGTTQEWRDAWFIGYTADYITGVWVGNDADDPMNHVAGGGIPASIWRDYMAIAHEGLDLRPLARDAGRRREPDSDISGEDTVAGNDELRTFLYRVADQLRAAARRMGR